MSEPYLPPRTAAEIANPAPPGSRHEQALRIAISLSGNGFAHEAIVAQLAAMYGSDATDRELHRIVTYAESLNPEPSGFGKKVTTDSTQPFRDARPIPKPAPREIITTEQAIRNAEEWLDGFRCDVADLWHASPWCPLEDWRCDSLMMICAAYGKAERVNIVTDYTTVEKDGVTKANPRGAGVTMLRDDWLRHIREHGTPQSKAGAWLRMNPVRERGSGKDGAFTDADVTAFRFALLESDVLSAEVALSIFARLPLPVFAIFDSGGRGPHCWLKLDCPDEDTYRAEVASILATLRRFGVDDGNKNPSRLSRLPGALRVIGASGAGEQREIGAPGAGEQRLFYLNDSPELHKPIFPQP